MEMITRQSQGTHVHSVGHLKKEESLEEKGIPASFQSLIPPFIFSPFRGPFKTP
jgi:hypothetical protein